MLPWWLVMACNCAAPARYSCSKLSVIETLLYVQNTNLTSLQGSTLNWYSIKHIEKLYVFVMQTCQFQICTEQRRYMGSALLCVGCTHASRAEGLGCGCVMMVKNIEGIAHIIQYLRFSNPALPFNLSVLVCLWVFVLCCCSHTSICCTYITETFNQYSTLCQ